MQNQGIDMYCQNNKLFAYLWTVANVSLHLYKIDQLW